MGILLVSIMDLTIPLWVIKLFAHHGLFNSHVGKFSTTYVHCIPIMDSIYDSHYVNCVPIMDCLTFP